METIGARIRSTREERGVARDDLAKAMGLAYTTLADLERGKAKSTTKLHKAAEALHVNVEWLETGRGPKDVETPAASQSQPMRLDAEIVRNVGAALNLRYEKAGGYNLAERPEEFVTAYRLWLGMDDAYDSPEVFNLVIRHADLSPQGASSDRGSEGAPTSGATGKGTGSGRRR